MNKSDFDFYLPERLIAQTPLEKRDSSRLLHLDKKTGAIEHGHFHDITKYLKKGDCLVMNDSRVLPARLIGSRLSGGLVELVLLRDLGDGCWECLSRPGRKTKPGTELTFGDGELTATVMDIAEGGNRIVKFHFEGIFIEKLEKLGKMPLPPYIKEELQDSERYQTVYSRELGSAAAPTAGLHFTKEILADLETKGVNVCDLTLHVGAGTFRPVKADTIGEHDMHTEHVIISRQLVECLMNAKQDLIAVGTTSVRTLESLYWMGVKRLEGDDLFYALGQWEAYTLPRHYTLQEAMGALAAWFEETQQGLLKAQTTIIIVPGYQFRVTDAMFTNFHQPQSTLRVTDAMFTNFHQPQSTLLLLVGAAVGEGGRC